MLAAALKRIGELKVALPNWRTLFCVADQGIPRWRACERAGSYWNSRLRQIQLGNHLGVVWGRSEVGRYFIVQPEKLKKWGSLASPVLTEPSGA